MPTPVFLGEFEQLVLPGILDLGNAAMALSLRERMEEIAVLRESRDTLRELWAALEGVLG